MRRLFTPAGPAREPRRGASEQETRALADFSRHFGIEFQDPSLLKLALTHRSYLSVTGQGPRESNERLEFLGDSVLGLVTSEFLYRQNPHEHEGQLTKTKSLLVSKAILSRRALALGLGRFVLMSHSEVESGGRQRLSILADAFEAVIGAIYLDQGFEAARTFIHRSLLKDTREIASDKQHANYKSYLQEYVQSTFHTHPVYRIRHEMGPDHSKQFVVDVMVGKRPLGTGKGRNKKEAEQAAARDALEQVGAMPRLEARHEGSESVERVAPGGPDARREREEREPWRDREERPARPAREAHQDTGPARLPNADDSDEAAEPDRSRRRGRRGGRGRRSREIPSGRPSDRAGSVEPRASAAPPAPAEPRSSRSRSSSRDPVPRETRRSWLPPDEELEEVGRPEGPLEERHVDVYDWEPSGTRGEMESGSDRQGSSTELAGAREAPAADDRATNLRRERAAEDEPRATDPESRPGAGEDASLEPDPESVEGAPRGMFSHDTPAAGPVHAEPSPPAPAAALYGRRGTRKRRSGR